MWFNVFTLCCHGFTFLQALPKFLDHVGLENHNMDILKGWCFSSFYVLFNCSDHCISNIHCTQLSNPWEWQSEYLLQKGMRYIMTVLVTSITQYD